jgi:hypothetical protein
MAKKTVWDYAINFPFGAWDNQYYFNVIGYGLGRKHHGDDRPTPVGTPIEIGGIIIGLSGNTGLGTGAHWHWDKFVVPVGTWLLGLRFYKKPPQTRVQSKNVHGRVIWAGWLGTAGKCVVIKQTTTATNKKRIFYRSLHLSEIYVKRGDWV